jgi:hypothetical protein
MPQRIIFGCPNKLDEEGLYGDHASLVRRNYGEHAVHNEDYYQYAGLGGGVAFAQEMPEEAQRCLAYNAYEDMREARQRDGVPRKGHSGAMGSLWVRGALRREHKDKEEELDNEEGDDEDNVCRGYQIYLGSSLRKRRRDADDVALEESLYDDLVDEDGKLPDHRRQYQCAEPGLLSEHRYANNWDKNDDDEDEDNDGGRIYVVNAQGEHLAPCGEDTEEYGCDDICDRVGAYGLDSNRDDE